MEFKPEKNKIYPYLISFSLVFLTTLFGEFAKKHLEPANIVMFYLLVVVFCAIRWGRSLAVTTSIVSVLAFDFFLVPPYLTFSVSHIQYIFTLAAFLIIGIIVSTFASKVREQVIQKQTEKLYSALLNSISHDLKTPLVSITGTLTALLDDKLNLKESEKRELIVTAEEEANLLNLIVNNLLDMTRMDAGVLRISPKPCDLRDLMGACLEQLKDKIGARKIEIEIPGDFPEVSVDFPFILKALYNVIDNALKYSSVDKPVLIQVCRFQGNVKIEIRDYGIGISGHSLKHIFEKFYRVESLENVSGMGLGLCISKAIVQAHGGRIWVESALGKGSVFSIEFPLKQ